MSQARRHPDLCGAISHRNDRNTGDLANNNDEFSGAGPRREALRLTGEHGFFTKTSQQISAYVRATWGCSGSPVWTNRAALQTSKKPRKHNRNSKWLVILAGKKYERGRMLLQTREEPPASFRGIEVFHRPSDRENGSQ